jgi:hypothetical protein
VALNDLLVRFIERCSPASTVPTASLVVKHSPTGPTFAGIQAWHRFLFSNTKVLVNDEMRPSSCGLQGC